MVGRAVLAHGRFFLCSSFNNIGQLLVINGVQPGFQSTVVLHAVRGDLHPIKRDIPGPYCPHLLPIHICRQSIVKVKALIPRRNRIALLDSGFRNAHVRPEQCFVQLGQRQASRAARCKVLKHRLRLFQLPPQPHGVVLLSPVKCFFLVHTHFLHGQVSPGLLSPSGSFGPFPVP